MPDLQSTSTIGKSDVCPHDDLDLSATGKRAGGGVIATVTLVCKSCGLRWASPLGKTGKYTQTPSTVFVPQPSNGQTAKPAQTVPAKKPELPKKEPLGEGPGMELKLIFTGLGVPACQACDDLAREMNADGLEKCEAGVDAIVEKILPRATEWLQRPEGGWTDRFKALAPNFAKRHVIKGYVELALTNWIAKQALKESAERENA